MLLLQFFLFVIKETILFIFSKRELVLISIIGFLFSEKLKNIHLNEIENIQKTSRKKTLLLIIICHVIFAIFFIINYILEYESIFPLMFKYYSFTDSWFIQWSSHLEKLVNIQRFRKQLVDPINRLNAFCLTISLAYFGFFHHHLGCLYIHTAIMTYELINWNNSDNLFGLNYLINLVYFNLIIMTFVYVNKVRISASFTSSIDVKKQLYSFFNSYKMSLEQNSIDFDEPLTEPMDTLYLYSKYFTLMIDTFIGYRDFKLCFTEIDNNELLGYFLLTYKFCLIILFIVSLMELDIYKLHLYINLKALYLFIQLTSSFNLFFLYPSWSWCHWSASWSTLIMVTYIIYSLQKSNPLKI